MAIEGHTKTLQSLMAPMRSSIANSPVFRDFHAMLYNLSEMEIELSLASVGVFPNGVLRR